MRSSDPVADPPEPPDPPGESCRVARRLAYPALPSPEVRHVPVGRSALEAHAGVVESVTSTSTASLTDTAGVFGAAASRSTSARRTCLAADSDVVTVPAPVPAPAPVLVSASALVCMIHVLCRVCQAVLFVFFREVRHHGLDAVVVSPDVGNLQQPQPVQHTEGARRALSAPLHATAAAQIGGTRSPTTVGGFQHAASPRVSSILV